MFSPAELTAQPGYPVVVTLITTTGMVLVAWLNLRANLLKNRDATTAAHRQSRSNASSLREIGINTDGRLSEALDRISRLEKLLTQSHQETRDAQSDHPT